MKIAAALLGILLLLFAVSCGGGGSLTTTSTTTPTTTQSTAGKAQGVYSGTSSNGWSFSSIVLPNDKYYAIYGNQSSSVFLIYGMMTGQGTSTSNTAYTATVNDYYYTGSVTTGTVNATYVAGTSISGTIVEGASTLSFTGTAPATSDFNYNAPASLSAVAGAWTGSALDGSSGTLNVSSTGSITGSLSGCSVTGTVTPDSAKNFYNVSITFGPSPCLLPGQTATGIAITYQISGTTKHQLLAGGTSSGGGTVFAAIR